MRSSGQSRRVIAAGLEEAGALFSHFGVEVEAGDQRWRDGKPGDVLLSLSGRAKKILLVERTALNIIGRMSGIATQTRTMADLVRAEDPRCRVAGTRKTCPGFRALDKKAVVLGGGDPHRSGLSDGILIKDNHLALVPVSEAIARAKAASAYRKIEIEVENAGDALAAARAGADILLFDNMTPDSVRKTIGNLEGGRAPGPGHHRTLGGHYCRNHQEVRADRRRPDQPWRTHSYGQEFFGNAGDPEVVFFTDGYRKHAIQHAPTHVKMLITPYGIRWA